MSLTNLVGGNAPNSIRSRLAELRVARGAYRSRSGCPGAAAQWLQRQAGAPRPRPRSSATGGGCSVLASRSVMRSESSRVRRRAAAARRAGRAAAGTSRPRRRSNDVVAVLEHLQQVARERDVPRQPLGHERVHLHQPDRDVKARPPHAERALQPLPELVPGDRVRPAELERPVRDAGLVDRGGEVGGGDVVDPDRLDLLRARADDRRHRRQLRELAERRQDPPSRPKTKLGRKITCSSPEPFTVCSISHFAW